MAPAPESSRNRTFFPATDLWTSRGSSVSLALIAFKFSLGHRIGEPMHKIGDRVSSSLGVMDHSSGPPVGTPMSPTGFVLLKGTPTGCVLVADNVTTQP